MNFHIILGLKLFIYYLNQTRCVSISEAMERSELGSERLEKYWNLYFYQMVHLFVCEGGNFLKFDENILLLIQYK